MKCGVPRDAFPFRIQTFFSIFGNSKQEMWRGTTENQAFAKQREDMNQPKYRFRFQITWGFLPPEIKRETCFLQNRYLTTRYGNTEKHPENNKNIG